MALTIRLKRAGRKNMKLWRIVVTERSNARDGRSLEQIGTYNPTAHPAAVTLKKERYDEWVRRGAKPSETVRTLAQKRK